MVSPPAGPPPRIPALLAALALLSAAGCGGDEAPRIAPPEAPAVTRAFAVDSLRGPESVAWDSARRRYLITNVSGDASAEDGDGFLSAVSPRGDSVDRRAVTGADLGVDLDAPKGVAVRGDRAWVADLRRVVGIDLRADTALFAVRIPESRFLNDVAVGDRGSVYVSDTELDAVFVVEPDGSDWRRHGSAGSLRGVNGLAPDPAGPGLLLAGWEGAVLRLNPDSSVTLLADPMDAQQLDGIQASGPDTILYTDYGRGTLQALHRRRPGYWAPSRPWLEGLTTPADFLLRGPLLAVPELEAGRVVFYRIESRRDSP